MRMYVSHEQNGKGIATKLMQVIKRNICIHTIEQIHLWLNSANRRSKNLYEKFGFQTCGTDERAIRWDNIFFSEDFVSLQLR
ncbi:hypothetical protein CNR22_03920 [Sphingobacteriaceae bacterium]|nr:hypothetical protein CNR22_03920 [Sphingobacteriaceae bacterium]